MGKVFAQLTPMYNNIISVEVDVGLEKNYPLIDRYSVLSIPTSIIIDKNGNIIDKFSGVYTLQQMKSKLELLTQ